MKVKLAISKKIEGDAWRDGKSEESREERTETWDVSENK